MSAVRAGLKLQRAHSALCRQPKKGPGLQMFAPTPSNLRPGGKYSKLFASELPAKKHGVTYVRTYSETQTLKR
jgi:hypothetical protein